MNGRAYLFVSENWGGLEVPTIAEQINTRGFDEGDCQLRGACG